MGPPERITARGRRRSISAQGVSWGQELGIDVELADPPGDELGELAAEVEHHDRVRLDRPVAARADRGRGIERHLEIGLDLGVVRCKDPMAGVGRLAVDGLAALGPAGWGGLRVGG